MTEARQDKRPAPAPKRQSHPMLWMVGLAALAVGALAGWYMRDFMAVNACLDAGGAWTQPGVCVGAPVTR